MEDKGSALQGQKRREELEQAKSSTSRAATLDDLFAQIKEGQTKDLNLILKTDVQGSIEPIKNSLEKLGSEEVKVRIIHSGTGGVTESDVMLAIASKGLIIGFNTSAEPGARRLAGIEGIDIRYYDVIYSLVGDVEKALKGMLEPSYVEVVEGRAEVRTVFSMRKKEKIAGVYVGEGQVRHNTLARVLRHGKVIQKSRVSSLKRFKDNVTEVSAGFECGMGIEGFVDFQVGDIIEIYTQQKVS